MVASRLMSAELPPTEKWPDNVRLLVAGLNVPVSGPVFRICVAAPTPPTLPESASRARLVATLIVVGPDGESGSGTERDALTRFRRVIEGAAIDLPKSVKAGEDRFRETIS